VRQALEFEGAVGNPQMDGNASTVFGASMSNKRINFDVRSAGNQFGLFN
jgi:hypothetical protein